MSMTGWRLGWLCGDAEVVRSALVLHGYTTTCASTVSQKAALAAWTEEAAGEREKARRTFRARRDRLLEHGVITVPGAAFGAEGEGFLRVSFCADLPVIAEGVRRMKQALGK